MKKNKNISPWDLISKIAIAFALLVSVLLMVNYFQYKTMDPVESELINTLVQRLNENPEDAALRDEIRALDLLSRKAYFTKQWQVKTGGYLLLLSVIILIIAQQMKLSDRDKEVELNEKESTFLLQKKTRFWVSIGGGAIVLTAFILAFFNHQDLGNNLHKAIQKEQLSQEKQNTEFIPEPKTESKAEAIEEIIEEEPAKPQQEKKREEPKEDQTEIIIEEKAPENPPLKEVAIIEEEPQDISEEVVAAFPSSNELKANFPAFRGFESNGIDFHKNIPTAWNGETGENILWKIKIPIHGYNSPIIWGDQLFISGANAQKREVYCIDRNSGTLLWTVEVKDIPGTPAKSPKVTDDTGLAAPSLTTNGQQVFALFGNSDLVALDMDGNQLWAQNLGPSNNHYGHSSSLVIHEDILIIQFDVKKNPRIMGLNIETGEKVWETPRKVKVSWASPVLVNTGDQMEVILAAEPIIASYNPKTGVENWQLDCIFGEVGPSIAYGEGLVFAVNEYATLVAIKPGETPEIIWENDELLSDVPSPIVKDGLLYLATSYGVIACYDAISGEMYWENEFDNGFYGSPMYADGNIFIMDMDGLVHVFKAAKTYEAIASNPLGENGMTTPAFMDGRIYIRGNEHLICIGK